MHLESIHSATGERLRRFPALTEEGLQAAITAAGEAFALHRDTSAQQRALRLRKLAHLLAEDRADLARLVALETGTPIRLAMEELARCVALCREQAEGVARLLSPELLRTEPSQSYVQWNPIGPILAVLPLETPLLQPLRFAVPSIAAGNVVLLKHASSVPQCALALEAMFRRAGFPRGVFTALLMDDGMVEAALSHEAVCGVTLTGTPAQGRALAAQAGWMLKRWSLHLERPHAMVVLPSADLDAATRAAAAGIAGGTGMPSRIVVHAAVYNEFVLGLVSLLEALRVGDPLKEDTDVGPLGTALARNSLEERVQAAVSAGGRVLTGGSRMVGSGWFFEPTLLGDVPPTSAAAQDALHGPAAFVFRANDLERALAAANAAPAGTVSVWTKDPAEQQHLLMRLAAETIVLNGAGDPLQRGLSPGAGRVRDFLDATTVVLHRQSVG